MLERKKRQAAFLLAIFAFAFFIRLFPVDISYFFWDEAVYLLHAQYFAGKGAAYTELNIRPPLVSLLASPFYLFELDAEVWSRILMAFLNSFFVLLAYFFGREFNEKTGILSAIIAALFPFHILASRWVMTDALAALFSAASIYFCLRAFKANKNSAMAMSGLLFSLAVLTKFTSILAIIVIAAIFYLKKFDAGKSAYFSIAFFTPLLLYLLFVYRIFGSPFRTIIDAFHVVEESNPAGLSFTLFSFWDFFGTTLVIFLAYLYRFFSSKGKNPLEKTLVFWSLLMVLYYIYILQRGVAKPPGIEWEAERFLLPALFPVILLCSLQLSRLKWKIAALILALAFSAQFPSYGRAYTPSIAFEDGIREATKGIALYAKENLPADAMVYCRLNCPVFAYYSYKKVGYIMGDKAVNLEKQDYVMNFKKENEARVYSNLKEISSMSRGKWEATLYENQ